MVWHGSAERDPVSVDAPVQAMVDRIEAFSARESGLAMPAVLVLPGGGYEHLAAHEGRDYAEWLTRHGFHAFVLRYPLAPCRHPAQIRAARWALEYIRSGAHGLSVDPNRVGVMGSSAGGHLAAMLATGTPRSDDALASRPDFAVLCYPVISFLEDAHRGSLANLLGPSSSDSVRRELSLELQVDAATPPTFVWFTADDEEVHVSNGLRFAAAMIEHHRAIELHVFPHGQHGLGLASDNEDVAQWTALCASWLARQSGK